jgi:hypothetical protein
MNIELFDIISISILSPLLRIVDTVDGRNPAPVDRW